MLLLTVFIPSAVLSQTAGHKLDTVVVTSTSVPLKLSGSASSVTILDEDYIDSQNTDNLADLLMQVPGLYVDQSAGMAGTASVYLRGGDPNFTLVLVDGVRVNNPNNSRGGSFDITTLATANVERIEIVRAPLSSLYGSDALSGVINIITGKGSKDFKNLADLSVSSEGGYRFMAKAGNTVGELDYSFSSSYHDDGEPVDESSYSGFSFTSSVGYSISDDAEISISALFSSTDKERFPDDSGGPEFAVIRDRESSETDQFITGIDLTVDHSMVFRQKIKIDLYYNTEDLNSPGVAPGVRNPGGVPGRNENSRFFRNEFKLINSYIPDDNLTLTFGVNTIYEDGKNRGELLFEEPVPTGFSLDRFYYGIFGEVIYKPAAGLYLTAGIRMDIPDEHDHELSPRLGISYYLQKTSTRFKFNYGEGFKLPSFFALGNPLVGNSELMPESSRSIDLGIEQYLFHHQLRASVTVFYNEFEDLIDLQEQPDLSLVNRSEVVSGGAELELLLGISDEFSISGNLSYIKTEIKGSEEQLRNRPEWLGNLVLIWEPYDDLRFFINGNYTGDALDSSVPTGDVELDGYFRLDSALSYRINESFESYLRIENLLDKDYQQFVGFDSPGFRPTIGLKGYF